MNANAMYFLVGIMLAALIGGGAYMYQQHQHRDGVEISVGRNGVSIERR